MFNKICVLLPTLLVWVILPHAVRLAEGPAMTLFCGYPVSFHKASVPPQGALDACLGAPEENMNIIQFVTRILPFKIYFCSGCSDENLSRMSGRVSPLGAESRICLRMAVRPSFGLFSPVASAGYFLFLAETVGCTSEEG